MVMWRLFFSTMALACAGCDAIPRDIDGTLARVGRDRQFRVGIVEPTGRTDKIRRYVARVAAASRATAVVEKGAAEVLLLRLEQGKIDLVLGRFDRKTPWATRVFALPPLATDRIGPADVDLIPIARNGENRWVALLDAQTRAIE